MLNSAVKTKPASIEAASQDGWSNDNFVGPNRPTGAGTKKGVMQQQRRHGFIGAHCEQEKMYGSDLWAPLARPTTFEFV
jgi:hypothetical protein